jgi:GTP-binding protein EngB required for normal cell division
MLGPRITVLRLFWTGASATLGYTGYKITEWSNWWHDQFSNFLDLLPKAKLGAKFPEEPSTDVTTISANSINEEEAAQGKSPEGEDPNRVYSNLIKKMIEVRDVLQAAGLGDKLTALPSIVVIGSQSSGKSSVLESLVGHHFLPKGHSMVTRRPLELTLVHDLSASEDYAILPGEIKLTNFDTVRKRIAELNEAAPAEHWISPEPIRVQIHSARIPDLTLIDLPGYIQVTNRQQPEVLKDRIVQLCDRYIAQGNNIILAVSAADVDLANSEAIKSSRRVDPLGIRTVGVITKLDLVDPSYASSLLEKESGEYPLKLGYIGVICDGHRSTASKFFASRHSSSFGIDALKRTLTHTLEQSLASSLGAIMSTVREDLKECRYQIKVHYNDRCFDEETYLKDFAGSCRSTILQAIALFPRERVRQILRENIERLLLELYQQNLWASNGELPSPSILTRHGIGKLASQAIAEALRKEIQAKLEAMAFGNPHTLRRILAELDEKITMSCLDTVDAIENAIKPLKADQIEWEPLEWRRASGNTIKIMQAEIAHCNEDLQRMNHERLKKAAQAALNDHRIPPEVTANIQSAVSLQTLKSQLEERLKVVHKFRVPEAVKQRNSLWRRIFKHSDGESLDFECRNEDDPDDLIIRKDPCQTYCPEVFFYLIAERLVTAATMYVHEELVRGTEHAASAAIGLALPSASQLAQENSYISRQIHLCKRMQALEKVRVLIAYLEQQTLKRIAI